jgi:hypothetical protein
MKDSCYPVTKRHKQIEYSVKNQLNIGYWLDRMCKLQGVDLARNCLFAANTDHSVTKPTRHDCPFRHQRVAFFPGIEHQPCKGYSRSDTEIVPLFLVERPELAQQSTTLDCISATSEKTRS